MTPIGVILTPIGVIQTPIGVILTPIGVILTPTGVILTPIGVILTPNWASINISTHAFSRRHFVCMLRAGKTGKYRSAPFPDIFDNNYDTISVM